MKVLRVRRFIAGKEAVAKLAAILLVADSVWFEFTPLPDGEYEIKVKDEEHPCRVLRNTNLLKEG